MGEYRSAAAGDCYKHLKRGSVYEVMSIEYVETSKWEREEGSKISPLESNRAWCAALGKPASVQGHIPAGSKVVFYCDVNAVFRGDVDGKLWARSFDEFHDGRFQRIEGALSSAYTPAAPPCGAFDALAVETIDRIRKRYNELAASPLGMASAWEVKPSAGKPLLYGGKRGLLAYGTIATWKEFDLIADVINSLPTLLMALSNAAPPPQSAASTVEPVLTHSLDLGPADFVLRMHPDDQFRIATRVAGNVGYDLVPEPEHPDSPHAAPTTSPEPQRGAYHDIRDTALAMADNCTSPEPDAVRKALIKRLANLQDHYSTSGQLGAGNERIFAECIAALSRSAHGGWAITDEMIEAGAKRLAQRTRNDLPAHWKHMREAYIVEARTVLEGAFASKDSGSKAR